MTNHLKTPCKELQRRETMREVDDPCDQGYDIKALIPVRCGGPKFDVFFSPWTVQVRLG